MGGLFDMMGQQPAIPPQQGFNPYAGKDPASIPTDPVAQLRRQMLNQPPLVGPNISPVFRTQDPKIADPRELGGLQSGQIIGPITRTVNYPIEAVDPYLRAGAAGILGETYGPMAATALEMGVPAMLGGTAALEEGGTTGALGEAAETSRLGRLGETGELATGRGGKIGYITPTQTEVLTRETHALPEFEGEERYHGTTAPVEMVGDPLYYSSPQSQSGPGLYTTNKYHVAQGYAGTDAIGRPTGGGVVYRITEKNPVKLLDSSAPIPKDVLSKLRARSELIRSGIDEDSKVPIGEFLGDSRRWGSSVRVQRMAQREIINAMDDAGYGGLREIGGSKMPGRDLHDVKIYWHPERDVLMREARPELHPRLPAPKIEGTTEEALARMREREPGPSEQMETPTGIANYWNRRYGERRLREMQEQMGGTVQ